MLLNGKCAFIVQKLVVIRLDNETRKYSNNYIQPGTMQHFHDNYKLH